MSEIVIKPDQMALAEGETVLITMALGSSLAVCMYDEEGGIGGLVHTLLPDKRREGNGKNGLRYVDTATRALFEAMKEAGAVPERIRVKLVGGAKIFCFAGQAGECQLCEKDAAGTGPGHCLGGHRGKLWTERSLYSRQRKA